MFSIISLLQEVDINEKIKEAPNDSYEIGVFIGSMLPFVTLVIIAYLLFRYNKNRKNNE
ncbi:hypothetical protein [Formosa maritima]|uniref:hypothetical protein n=1 Tax=Formosa maritima TaxID=2592046 RepID=UPI0018F78694|nr:hypothetical protein [Formosa maritima]